MGAFHENESSLKFVIHWLLSMATVSDWVLHIQSKWYKNNFGSVLYLSVNDKLSVMTSVHEMPPSIKIQNFVQACDIRCREWLRISWDMSNALYGNPINFINRIHIFICYKIKYSQEQNDEFQYEYSFEYCWSSAGDTEKCEIQHYEAQVLTPFTVDRYLNHHTPSLIPTPPPTPSKLTMNWYQVPCPPPPPDTMNYCVYHVHHIGHTTSPPPPPPQHTHTHTHIFVNRVNRGGT